MVTEVLPQRAKPPLLQEITQLLRNQESVTKTEIYDSIDENQKTLRRTLLYGEVLGFLEQRGEDEFALTNRGSVLSYQPSFDGSPVEEVFREAIEEFEPYRKLLLLAAQRGIHSEVLESTVFGQSDLKELAAEFIDSDVESREINVFIKTADAAGLGEYRAGKRGYETRLILSDGLDEFSESLLDKYGPLPDLQSESGKDKDGGEDEESKEVTSTDSINQIMEASGNSSGEFKLTIELNVNDKSEAEIARLVKRIQNMA